MDFVSIIVIIVGLALFEIISSIDNAVINADVLGTMHHKARRWFLVYGIFIAVVLVRGLLPLLIVWAANPSLGIVGAFSAAFSQDQGVMDALAISRPILLAGGGIYLIFLSLHWLFLETKKYAFFIEKHIHRKYYFWFYACVAVILLVVVWMALFNNPNGALGAVIGSSAFFITNGFKQNAEARERRLTTHPSSAVGKILYLELIDATFSIDGVLGAFAFTLSVPLILIGNGLGAIIVRYFTVHGVKTVKKYRYLKNGAMYSVGFLGTIMVMESFGLEAAVWLPPAITVAIALVFFWLSKKEIEIRAARA